ncbi:hypothetical protein SDC9_157328 [bioreactor metagenome]|uniref:Uncharacterized protein n=1 Tax=bioreactor metagenome TaxID=1076179 RepID=A0A645F6N8_9ZZZZ
MTTNTLRYLSIVPSGEGKSVLEAMLRLQGVNFITGPVYLDGSADLASADDEAHDLEACMTNLHDTVSEATGKSLSDADLHAVLLNLPRTIRKQVKIWGVADTEVREQIYRHLQHSSETNQSSST